MGIENVRYAAVNLSTTKIPVYEKLVHSSVHTGSVTVGGNVIGHIHQYEFYTVIPNSSNYITSFKIYFLDGNNNCKYGYIETLPATTFDEYAWNKYQYPYQYYNSNGSKLVESAKTVPINGDVCRIFTVKRTVSYKSPSGTTLGTIPVGTQLACKSSTTGVSNPGYMVFYYKRNSSVSAWTKINSTIDYAFVDLGLSGGAMPNNRAIW